MVSSATGGAGLAILLGERDRSEAVHDSIVSCFVKGDRETAEILEYVSFGVGVCMAEIVQAMFNAGRWHGQVSISLARIQNQS